MPWGRLQPHVQAIGLQVLDALGNRRTPIILAGAVGAGKSQLAALVARLYPTWRFWSCAQILTLLMDCRTSQTGSVEVRGHGDRPEIYTEQRILRLAETVSLLVLDDVGTGELTAPKAEALLEILNRRLEKPLIATTNHDHKSLPRAIGERATSRLCAGVQYSIQGPDLRKLPR